MSNKILYIIPILLAACSPAASTPTLIAPQTSTISVTKVPTFTPRPTIAATFTISPSKTLVPTPSIYPTQIPGWDYDTPISPEPPWLVHYHEGWGLFLTNIDGSGFRIISTPEKYPPGGLFLSQNYTSPDSDLLALVNPPWFDGTGASIGIASILTGELIFETSMVGETAKENIEEEGRSNLERALYWADFLWSPDGKYLAFVGALEGTTSEIYIYNVSQNEVRKLTETPSEVALSGWSPDGENIIFYSYSAINELNDNVGDIRISNINGISNILYSIDGIFYNFSIIGWMDKDVFIGYVLKKDEPEDQLALINTKTGDVEIIFEGDSNRIIFDDIRYPRLFISFGSPFESEEKELTGSYEYNFDKKELELFNPGIKMMDYIGELNYYTSYHYLDGESPVPFLNIYNLTGDVIITSDANWFAVEVSFHVSRDNQFIYIFSIGVSLYSTDGTYIRELKSTREGNYYIRNNIIYFSEKIDNEELVVLYEISQENGWELIEIARFPATHFSVIAP